MKKLYPIQLKQEKKSYIAGIYLIVILLKKHNL